MQEMNLFGNTQIMQNGFEVTESMITGECPEGSENKFYIVVNGIRYLVKDSSFNTRRKQPSLAPYCEYVGSTFIRLSGLLECQTCYLGTYNGRTVVICKDIFNGYQFRPFRDLHQSSAGTDLHNKLYTYDDVLYVLKQKSKLVDSRFKDFHSKFWTMFLLDAILGNRDRHEGNWGFIKDNSKTFMAPIFDNGASLFPDVDLTNCYTYDFVKMRVYTLPGSQLKMWKPGVEDRPMRTNYYEIIRDYHDVFSDELDSLRQLDIDNLIEQSIIYVPEEYAAWFKTIIKFRYECLIMGRDYDSVWEDYNDRCN